MVRNISRKKTIKPIQETQKGCSTLFRGASFCLFEHPWFQDLVHSLSEIYFILPETLVKTPGTVLFFKIWNEFLRMPLKGGVPTTAVNKEILDLKPQGKCVALEKGGLFEEGNQRKEITTEVLTQGEHSPQHTSC